jgi:hypothetical protein
MASFNRVHGDAKPVVNIDVADKFDDPTLTGVAVNLAGPKLDLFSIHFDNGESPENQMGTGGAIEAVMRTVQQLATVHMYQVNDESGTSCQLSLAIYPTGAWTASTLETAIRGLGTVNGYDMDSTDIEAFSNFQLIFVD